jgi:hypothetical protein
MPLGCVLKNFQINGAASISVVDGPVTWLGAGRPAQL